MSANINEDNDKVVRQQPQRQQQQSNHGQPAAAGLSNNSGLKKQLEAIHSGSNNNNSSKLSNNSTLQNQPANNSKAPVKQLHQAGYPMVTDDSFVDGTAGQGDNDVDQLDRSSQVDDRNDQDAQDPPQKAGKRGSDELDELPAIRQGNSNKNINNPGQSSEENHNNLNEGQDQQGKGLKNINNNQSYINGSNSSKQSNFKENRESTPVSQKYNDLTTGPAVKSAGNSAKTKSEFGNYGQCEKLLQQNQNLREQLKEMATLLDEITAKEQDQKGQRYGIGSSQVGLENEQIKQRRKELQRQTELIASNRILIQQKKRQLEYNFDINRITEKENEVKRLKKQLEEINAEKLGLKRISDEQKKAKNDIDRQEYKDQVLYFQIYVSLILSEKSISSNIFNFYNPMLLFLFQLDFAKRQFLSVKEENLRLNEELKQKDKELKKYIDELKMRTEKIRTVQGKLKEQQRKKKVAQPQEPDEEISEEALSILEEKVKVLETEKANLEKSFVDKMKTMEKERKTQQAQVDKKLLVLKEREKTLKLTQLKIKEITKFIKASAIENEKKQQIVSNSLQQQEPQLDEAPGVSRNKNNIFHGKARASIGQVSKQQ